jgi:hypothetical protein
LWAILIVATSENANPVDAITCCFGYFSHTLSLGQEPDDVEMTAFYRISRLSVAILQFIDTEMRCNTNIFGHGFPFLSENDSSRGISFQISAECKACRNLFMDHTDLV